MRYLLDTGILARLPHRADPLHQPIRSALRKLLAEQHSFVTSTQNIAEFWNLCTRPASARGGFGLTIEETAHRVRLLERFVTILKEPDSAYRTWKSLVITCSVSGKQVHDARLAACMRAYRLKRILTLNPHDFSRYPRVDPITPDQILQTARLPR
jgi:predicted nucleic acid-binding protein